MNMMRSSVFCFTHLMGFLNIQMCSSQYYRIKPWIFSSVRQGLRNFVTTVSERGGDLVKSTVWSCCAHLKRLRDLCAHYQQLHSNTLNNIICQIRNRFQDHKKLFFLSLHDPQQFQTYRKKFPHTAFSSLTQSQNTIRPVPSKNRTDCSVCHDWFWREKTHWSWFPSEKKIWVTVWGRYTHWHAWLWLSLCPLLLSSGHSQPWREFKLMPEIGLNRFDFQH